MANNNLVGVRYIGTKSKKGDNVANTGAEWVPGQVINFTADVAQKLIAHKAVWEITNVDPDGETHIGGKKSAQTNEPVPFVNLHTMDINALAAYAKVEFNQTIDTSLSIDDARIRVHGFMSNQTLDELAEEASKRAKTFSLRLDVSKEEYDAYIAGDVVLRLVPKPYEGSFTGELVSAEGTFSAESVSQAEETQNEIASQQTEEEAQQEPESEEPETQEESKTAIEDLKDSLMQMDKKSLRDLCKEYGLPVSNTMSEEVLRNKLLAKAGEV